MKNIIAALVFGYFGLIGSTLAQAQQVIKVGFVYSSAPWSWYDVRSNSSNGAMLDLMTEIGKDNSFQVEFHGATTVDLIAMLGSHIVDVVASNWASTPDRQAASNFSTTVVFFNESLLVRQANSPGAKTLGDFKGKTVAVTTGTIYEQEARKIDGLSVKSFRTGVDGYEAVRSGQADAYMSNQPSAAYLAHEGTLPEGIVILKGYEPQYAAPLAIAVRKDNPELLEKINVSLRKLENNGTLGKIFAKYGVEPAQVK